MGNLDLKNTYMGNLDIKITYMGNLDSPWTIFIMFLDFSKGSQISRENLAMGNLDYKILIWAI